MVKHKVSNSRDQIGFTDLSKLINKKRVRDIRIYNVRKIEEAVKNGRSKKSVRRKLGIGQFKMYALKDKQGNVISNFDKNAQKYKQGNFISNFDEIVNQQKFSIRSCTVPRVATLPSFKVVMRRIQRLFL